MYSPLRQQAAVIPSLLKSHVLTPFFSPLRFAQCRLSLLKQRGVPIAIRREGCVRVGKKANSGAGVRNTFIHKIPYIYPPKI